LVQEVQTQHCLELDFHSVHQEIPEMQTRHLPELEEALEVKLLIFSRSKSWKPFVQGILEGKYDVAMCGMNRNLSRHA
jgi:hypothetical protein